LDVCQRSALNLSIRMNVESQRGFDVRMPQGSLNDSWRGSADNTGGSETGANSNGSKDIAKLYASVNPAYRASDKCAFFMNGNTRAHLSQITTKLGIPLVNWVGGDAYILGKEVKVCPGMDDIGASNSPVVFGDGAYWMTRMVQDDLTFVQLVKEAPGLRAMRTALLRSEF
jgi:HK97 family phage major capsid protein